MRGINKVILIGNVGVDPEIRRANNGNAVTNLSLATSETWRDKNSGEMIEKTEWHRVVFFGRSAEIIGEYVRKGSKIYVEGRLQTRKWTAQDGQDRYTTEVVVDVGGKLQLLDSRSSSSDSSQGNNGYERNENHGNDNYKNKTAPPTLKEDSNMSNMNDDGINDSFEDDDIPF